jgi:hypothetical protein
MTAEGGNIFRSSRGGWRVVGISNVPAPLGRAVLSGDRPRRSPEREGRLRPEAAREQWQAGLPTLRRGWARPRSSAGSRHRTLGTRCRSPRAEPRARRSRRRPRSEPRPYERVAVSRCCQHPERRRPQAATRSGSTNATTTVLTTGRRLPAVNPDPRGPVGRGWRVRLAPDSKRRSPSLGWRCPQAPA